MKNIYIYYIEMITDLIFEKFKNIKNLFKNMKIIQLGNITCLY